MQGRRRVDRGSLEDAGRRRFASSIWKQRGGSRLHFFFFHGTSLGQSPSVRNAISDLSAFVIWPFQ